MARLLAVVVRLVVCFLFVGFLGLAPMPSAVIVAKIGCVLLLVMLLG